MEETDSESRNVTPRGFAYKYERFLEDYIYLIEQVLINDAIALRDEAVEYLTEYRALDEPSINLGIVVRVRYDTLGPRAEWVKFQGKSRKHNGQRFTPTSPIKQRSKYQFNPKIFERFPDHIRDALIEIEKQFAVIRFRTERLAALRDLCRQKSTYIPKDYQ